MWKTSRRVSRTQSRGSEQLKTRNEIAYACGFSSVVGIKTNNRKGITLTVDTRRVGNVP